MKILIVDDHPLALQGIDFILRSADHDTILANNFESARNALQQPLDYLLLDYHLAEQNGMDLLRLPDIALPEHILIFSGLLDPEDIIFALETSPAHAFISKQIDLADLPCAITQLKELDHQKIWIWNSVKQHFVNATEAFPEQILLTSKERAVYMLLRQGLLDKQIADLLDRSIHTIRVQIRAIKRKRKTIRRSV